MFPRHGGHSIDRASERLSREPDDVVRQAEGHDADAVDGERERGPRQPARGAVVLPEELEVEEAREDERDDGRAGRADKRQD